MKIDELKVGVVGMGKMGLLHAGILNSINSVKLHAIADTEKIIRVFFKKNGNGIGIYDDYKKMIENSNLDLIYITTPVISHIPIASFCAERNIPFFIEKPLGRNAEECTELCNLVNKNKIINMVGFYLRYATTFMKAKEFLDNGDIGQITGIKSSVYQTQSLFQGSGWRFKKESSGGGVLIDLGSHLIDLLIWFFGNIKTVQARTESQHTKEVEDSVTAKIEFENNLRCSFDASWNMKNFRLQETTVEVEGTHGKMKVNEDYVKLEYNDEGRANNKQNSIFYRQMLHKGVPIDIAGPEYTNEDLNFIECVRNRKQPSTNVTDSVKVQSVIDHIYKASESQSMETVKYIEY